MRGPSGSKHSMKHSTNSGAGLSVQRCPNRVLSLGRWLFHAVSPDASAFSHIHPHLEAHPFATTWQRTLRAAQISATAFAISALLSTEMRQPPSTPRPCPCPRSTGTQTCEPLCLWKHSKAKWIRFLCRPELVEASSADCSAHLHRDLSCGYTLKHFVK